MAIENVMFVSALTGGAPDVAEDAAYYWVQVCDEEGEQLGYVSQKHSDQKNGCPLCGQPL
jgi:hypothetical protein